MVRSMTGFGRGIATTSSGAVAVEIRTVNHKFLELSCKLPNSISAFEDKIKQLLQKKIRRGKVNLNLICDGALAKEEAVSLNLSMAKSYMKELCRLKKTLHLKGDITVEDLILFPGVLNYETKETDLMKQWPKVEHAVKRAIERLLTDREKEGKALHRDLARRVRRIKKMLEAIYHRSTSSLVEYRKKFAERVRKLTGTQTIEPGRLEMEVAIFAKNCDISEEIIRLRNHLVNFRKTISGNGEAGKKLDFIAQELHREINTIGAKASDFRISKNVINIKSEIEKIREQVKNIE